MRRRSIVALFLFVCEGVLRYFRVIAFFALVIITYMACDPIDGDIDTLREKARAKLKIHYTVTFDINLGSGETPIAERVKAGKSITLPYDDDFSRSGYTFGGWDTQADGTGINYDAGDSFTPVRNITLYAKWNAVRIPGILVDMVWIPGGSFEMGSNAAHAESNEQPVHTVTLRGFYMGKYEVTQAQYKAVMGNNPSYFSGNNLPVECVSWEDAVEFCNKLSEMGKLQPVYTISGTTVTADWSKNGYRLPTEAEWEYAAKGGNGSPGNYTYSGSNNPDEVAWYEGNSGGNTHEVGTQAPNGLGLYDMSGNVWELCWDWYGNYLSGLQTEPKGAPSGSYRIGRGGGWHNSAESTYRDSYYPFGLSADIGLRLARTDNPPLNYTVTFNINGGSGTVPTTQVISAGSSITLPGGSNLSKTGYTFGGWNTHEFGMGTNYNGGASYTPVSTITLYARWDTVVTTTTCTVTFNTNGGSGTTPSAQTANAGSSITLPSGSGLSKTGYVFGGWNINESGTGTNYNGGSSYTVTSDITLYARWIEAIVSATGVEMIRVAGGSFEMGDAGYDYSSPVHTVTVSSFYMGKYEVTQAQYEVVMGTNPSYFSSSPAAGETQNKRPVETVTWYDAVEFCNKLSEREGLQPVYTISNRSPSTGYPITEATVTADWSKNGYRLPTEAQWEYAAKGGNGSPGNYTYSGSNNPDEVAWYWDNSGSKTHEIGTKAPNGLGLYDMSGNVWEWCWDWYGSYSSSTQTDPVGTSSGSDRVVIRGGYWYNPAEYVRSASRYYNYPFYGYVDIGFRLVRP